MPTIKGAYPLNTTDTLTFQTPKSSFYLLKVKAKAKSEKQRDSIDDEDITIKIDTLEFPKPNTLSKLINSLLGKTPESEFINLNNTEFIHNTYPPDVVLNVLTPKESIFWGVRWLYHKAQGYVGVGENLLSPPFTINWRSWSDAVYNYNASGNVEEYIEEVFSVYEKGVDLEGNILWE